MMSEEYYLKIKCVRGGGESGKTDKYTLNYFHNYDNNYNKIVDDELFKKNYTKLIPFFDKNDLLLFNKYLKNSKYYFEYGSGGSTYQASICPNINKIISVESDLHWYNKLNYLIKNKDKLKYQYCEMDTLPNTFGYPGPKSTLEDWKKYSRFILTLDNNLLSNIDLILIDGRFRVACCLNCFDVISEKCLIIFDDFLNRPHYHIVLDYFNIIEQTVDKKMVILQKKQCCKPSKELIEKYEFIKE